MKKQYDLAISFAGENRQIAERIADNLSASGYNVFYDSYFIHELWGSDLPVKLGEIYGGQSRFCLMIISKKYLMKMWTNHERRFAIQESLKFSEDYILPLKLEDISVPGLPDTIGYINYNTISHDKLCQVIIKKIGNPENFLDLNIDSNDVKIVEQILSFCYTRAIFTRMRSEISYDAMFVSIGHSISQIQKLIPKLKSQYIQKLSLEILVKLDEVERFRNDHRKDRFFKGARDLIQKIDSLKLDVIKNLHILRREGKIYIQLPTTTQFDHFFSLEEANDKPTKPF